MTHQTLLSLEKYWKLFPATVMVFFKAEDFLNWRQIFVLGSSSFQRATQAPLFERCEINDIPNTAEGEEGNRYKR